MCFHIDEKKCPNMLVAAADIICWKTTENNFLRYDGFISSYRGFRYRYNKTYKMKFKVKPRDREINDGFHSYRFLMDASVRMGETSIRCCIPKGSNYYYNKDQYVSECIEILDKKYVNEYKKIPWYKRFFIIYNRCL